MADLEKKAEKQEQERQEVESRAQAASLVARETELSKREQEQYRQFLEKDYFTKADFGALEGFYSNAYDRLSEGGKDQMSQRVWGGVKRGEYQFTELPGVVKEKEAQRLEQMLNMGVPHNSKLEQIPEEDRSDFLKSREQGRKEDSYKVLNRTSFGVALGGSGAKHVSAAVVDGQEAHKETVVEANKRKPVDQPKEKAKMSLSGDFDLADLGTFADPVATGKALAESKKSK